MDKGGWLNQLGFDDFAFGAVVHGLGGAASLAAAYMAGPRIDRYDYEGKIKHIPLHSTPVNNLHLNLYSNILIRYFYIFNLC